MAKMFGSKKAMLKIARDRDGAYLLDTNPDYFKPILQFLRRGEVAIDPGVSHDGVSSEAKFFGIKQMLYRMRRDKNGKEISEDLDVVRVRSKDRIYPQLIVKTINKQTNYSTSEK